MSAVIGQARADAATEVRRHAGIATDLLLRLAASVGWHCSHNRVAAIGAGDCIHSAIGPLAELRSITGDDIDDARALAREALHWTTGLSVEVQRGARLDDRDEIRNVAGDISVALDDVMVAVRRLEAE